MTDPNPVDRSVEGPATGPPPFRDGLLAAVPSLRAFATSLVRDRDRADDLVQETITRAWAHRDRFVPGTNLGAWLFTILRNQFYSTHRGRKREVEDVDGSYASRLSVRPEQPGHMDFQDLRIALQKLPFAQREALLLVAAEGLAYEEAAAITGVAVGTVKSRVNRARASLTALMRAEDRDAGP